MLRTLRKEGGGLWLEFNQVEVEDKASGETSKFEQEVMGSLQGVMTQFAGYPKHQWGPLLRGARAMNTP